MTRAASFREVQECSASAPRPPAAALAALAVLLLAAGLYALTLCPAVHVAGTGENATAAATLGVPHPPGFPLFCLLGRLAVLALPGPPARAVNGLAAASGAAAAAVLAWLVARLTGRGLAGVGAGLLLAASRTFWSQAVIAEVYTLSALLLALELALLLAWRGELGGGAARRDRWLLAFAFAFGVGASVHPIHALMLPGYAVLVWTARRRPRLPVLGWAVALAALGLSLHLYAPLRSARDPVLDWGDPEGGKALFGYLTAAQYRGRMFSLSPAEIGANLARLGRLLLGQWSPPFLVLPAAGALLLARRRPALAAGLGLAALADVVYAVNYDIPWEIEVYYIPLVLLLAAAAGVAIGALAERLRAAGAAAAALALVPAGLNFAGEDLRRADLVDRYGRDVLDALPPGAVLITPPVNPTFILLYLTAVEGARPDVRIYVDTGTGLAPLGEALKPGERPEVTPWSLANEAGHPLFYAARDPLDDLPGYRLEPAAVVYRVVRPGEAPGAAAAPPRLRLDPERDVGRGDDMHLRLIGAHYWIAGAERALAGGDSAGGHAALARARGLAGDLAAVEGAIGLALAAAGDAAGAVAAYERALALQEDAVLLNRLGRLRLMSGDAAGAEADFRRAIELDGRLAMAHSNLGALLGQRGDYKGAVAALDRAVELDPLSVKAHNNLGTALLLGGEPRRAAEALRRSLALNPDQPQVAALLGRAEAER